MASQGTTATSRLAQIQMRFQQKQLQEREQRKMEMTTPKSKAPEINECETTTNYSAKSTTTKTLNSTIGNGKVRQMFNERRRGAGIDRSNPLKPITSRSSSSSSTITTTSVSSKNADQTFVRRQEVTTLRPINGRKLDTKTSISKLTAQNIENGIDSTDYNENTSRSHQHGTYRNDDFNLDNETFPDQHLDNFDITLPSKLASLSFDTPAPQHNDRNNNSPSTNKSRPSAGIKLNPVMTRKSPAAVAAKTSRTSLSKPSPALNTTQKATPPKPKVAVRKSQSMTKPLDKITLATKEPPRTSAPTSHPPGTVPCRICSRYFNEDRLVKHEEVCEKMAQKQRKIFDASKHRVQGTEAEKFLKKPARGAKATANITKTASVTVDPSKKSNWRKKHEEFIAAIRAAKEVQAHLARGGKLSDLPPPPPSENPDYVTCPHCSRRFNEAAADRHIPKCANMLHNKPKPAAKRK